MTTYSMQSIGKIHTSGEEMCIKLKDAYIPGLQALDGFSHLNIFWWFSEFDTPDYRRILDAPKPYKNGPDTMGVFATRSPLRPNPIALSTAAVLHIDTEAGIIYLAWIDAHDGTPVLDIKPYTPSMDRIEHPRVPDWCRHWPPSLETSADFAWEKEFNF